MHRHIFKGIDLSSDTATKPSKGMKEFMLNVELGDEQKREDPTTLRLETMAANLFKFDHAIFLPSATMANQIAIQALSNPGEGLLAAENCHLFQTESEALKKHAEVIFQSIPTATGIFTDKDLKKHYLSMKASATVLSIENTVNLGGGAVWPKQELIKTLECAKALNLKIHLDGARVFNACVKLNLTPSEISRGFDMVTVCLSKGLGCPVGALLLYNGSYNQKISYLKKLMGGAMRQTGILSAAGIYALENNVDRLAIDHEHANLFANGLSKINKIQLLYEKPDTNIVFFEWRDTNTTAEDFLFKCKEKGLRFSLSPSKRLRAVMHLDISFQDVIRALEIVKDIIGT